MILNERSIRAVTALAKKDMLLETASRRFIVVYSALIFGFLLWASLSPNNVWLAGPTKTGISAASQLFGVITLLNCVFVPFALYMSIIQDEKRSGAFVLFRAFPIDLRVLFWGRVISCWLLTMLPVLIAYLFLVLLRASGILVDDILTPILLGARFPFFLLGLAWLTSTSAVGLALNIDPRSLPLVVTIISVIFVSSPFLLLHLAGVDFDYLLVKLIQIFGTPLKASASFLLLSLLLGWILSWLFRRKHSYV